MKVEIKIVNYINMQLNFNSKIVLFFLFCYFLTSFTHCSAYSSGSSQRAHRLYIIWKVWVDNAGRLRSLEPASRLCIVAVVLQSVVVAGVKPFWNLPFVVFLRGTLFSLQHLETAGNSVGSLSKYNEWN